MPTTSPDSLPYPGDGDPPDGPGQIGALAGATQTALNGKVDDATLTNLYRSGVATVPTDATFKSSVTIDFTAAGFTQAPYVVATVAGDRTKRIVTITATSTTSATITVHTTDGAALGTDTSVYWLAMRRN